MSTIRPIFSCGQTTVKFSPQLIGFALVSLVIHLALILSNQVNIQPDSGGASALRVHIITHHNETPGETPETLKISRQSHQPASTTQNKTKYLPKLVALKKSASQTVSAHVPKKQPKEEAAEIIITAKKSLPVKAIPQAPTSIVAPTPGKTTLITAAVRDRQATAARNRAIDQERNALTHQLQQALKRYFNYPLLARRRGWQGEVLISFTLGSSGKITDIRIASSSGHNMLDRAALTTLRKIDRIASVPQYTHSFELPVIYQLQDG